MSRHIAVLERPTPGPPRFTFPAERSADDHRSNYWHGQKYANGGFTGERCLTHRAGPYRGRRVFFRLADHEARLQETLAAHEHLDFGCTPEQRIDARFRLMTMNAGDTYLSVIFGSEGATGVYPKIRQPSVVMTTADMDPVRSPYLDPTALRRGLKLRVTEPDIRRKPPGRIARAKVSANYLESNIAKHRALEAGCDDGLLLDHTGRRIAEASVSNLVIVTPGCFLTPWADSAALPGLTLRTVGQLGEDLATLSNGRYHRMAMHENPCSVDNLHHISGAFLTGTAIGVVKVASIQHYDGTMLWQLHDDEASALIDDMTDLYWRLLYGEFEGYHPEWFTPIPEAIVEEYSRQLHLFNHTA